MHVEEIIHRSLSSAHLTSPDLFFFSLPTLFVLPACIWLVKMGAYVILLFDVDGLGDGPVLGRWTYVFTGA